MRKFSKVFVILAVLGLVAPAAFAQRDVPVQGNVFAPPFVPTQTLICLQPFCDTILCGRDQQNYLSCEWDWDCSGVNQEEMLGTKTDADSATIAGEVAGLAGVFGFYFDVETRLFDLFSWNGVGSTTIFQDDQPFQLNCVGPNVGAPSLLESSGF